MNGSKGKKILLVDDDDALRQSLGEQLQLHEEFTIIEADNGTEALSLAKGRPSRTACHLPPMMNTPLQRVICRLVDSVRSKKTRPE